MKRILLLWVWLLSAGCCFMTLHATETKNPQAVTDLLNRIGGSGTSDRFVTIVDDGLSTNGKDIFVITSQDGQPCIKGNSIIAVTTGINWYLNHYAHVNLTWNQLTTDLTSVTLPVPTAAERHECSVDYRYYLNYCTFSYSMSTWTWDRWQKEIDWMALHGINMPLQIVGLDVVWKKLLTTYYGYSSEEANAFVAGPCFQAWWGMNNLEGWGGPNPDWWYTRQEQLSKKINTRMRELGMQPVLPGFCGMVPSNFEEKTGNAAKNQGGWCGFTRPYILNPNSEAFTTMAERYYAILKEVMGTSEYYSMDPFHEGANTDGIDVPAAYEAIYKAMKAANESIDEKWVIQFWQWSPAQKNVLDVVRKGDLIVLDLFSDAHTHFGEYKGHDAVYCMLHNFGGRTGFYGRLNGIINGFFNQKASYSNIKGIGATPEAIETVPVVYDALFELPWYASKPDPQQWLADYTYSRYGQENSNAKEAWELLRNSSLNCTSGLQGPMEGVVCARPSLNVGSVSSWGGTAIFYDPQEVARAAYMLQQSGLTGENYSYDLTDLSRQALTDYAYYLLKAINDANSAKNTTLFEARRNAFLQLILDLDELLNTNKDFILGRWTQLARGIADEVSGTTDADKNWLELNNARTLITTWGDRDQANGGGLRDYSYRMWGGMMKDYYYPRWKYFFDNDLNGTDWFDMEWKWAHNTGGTTYSYANTTTGDTKAVAEKLFGKYFIPITVNDGSKYFVYRTMDNDLSKLFSMEGFRGQSLVLPFSIPAGMTSTFSVDFNGDGSFGEDESVSGNSIQIPENSATSQVKAKLDMSDGTVLLFNVVLKDKITTARTVSVATAVAGQGSVAIQGSTETSVTNTDYVTIVANPASGYDFVKWVDADGNLVSSNATYTYYGASAASFTAHFIINKWGTPAEDWGNDKNDIVGYKQYVSSISLTQYGEEEELYSTASCPETLFNTVSRQVTAAPGGSFTIDWEDAGGLQYTYLSAYIDLDNDGDFNKTNELIAVKGSHNSTSSHPCSGPITVTLPFDVPEGLTHLRLRFDGAWKTGYDATSNAFDAKATLNRMCYDILVNVKSPAHKAVTVTVQSSNTERGTVDANGQPDTYTYPVGEQVILRAYPKDGYKIDYWQDQNGRVLPKEWMDGNNIKFYPYDNATISAVFAYAKALTYNDWKFAYEEIDDKVYITRVDQAGSGALDMTQANSVGKELMGIAPATFHGNTTLISLSLPASCIALDNYLNTSYTGAGTENATITPEVTIPGKSPWQLTLCGTTDGSSFNNWGSSLLATGTNALADYYTGGFQLYWAKNGTLTAKVNGPTATDFSTTATSKFKIVIVHDGQGKVTMSLYADDKDVETKTFTGVTFNDITTFSHSIPAGINVTSLFISDPTLHNKPFSGCSAVEQYAVAEGNAWFQAVDGNLCSKSSGDLLAYAEGKLYQRAYTLKNASDEQYATTNPPADANGKIQATDYNNTERVVSTAASLTPAALVRFAKESGKNEIFHLNSGGSYGGKSTNGGNGQQIEVLASAEWAGDYTLNKRSEFGNGLVADVSLTCDGFYLASSNSKFILSNTEPSDGNASVWQLAEATSLPITVSDALWTATCLPVDVVVPATDVCKVYIAETLKEGNYLSLTQVPAGTLLKAGEGVVINTSEAKTINLDISYTGEAVQLTSNRLDGATARRTGLAAETFYGLGNKEGVGFYLSAGTEVPANKAYLLASKVGSKGASALLFDFSQQTGISLPEANAEEDGIFYNLRGQRVLYPSTGVYVTGSGKKVLIK